MTSFGGTQYRGLRSAREPNSSIAVIRRATRISPPGWATIKRTFFRAYLVRERLRGVMYTNGVLALTMLRVMAGLGRPMSPRRFRRNRSQGPQALPGRRGARSLRTIEPANRERSKLRVLHRETYGFRAFDQVAFALFGRGRNCPRYPVVKVP